MFFFVLSSDKVAVEAELTGKGLQRHPFLIMKIIQLFDSQLTRHCNMLVGRYCIYKLNLQTKHGLCYQGFRRNLHLCKLLYDAAIPSTAGFI